jgi:hypothetical protein
MRAILALLLSLILAVASQTEAVARSEMAGASDQVLCGANGVTTVTLDAAGQVVHSHPCTHCLAAATAVADLPGPLRLPTAPVTRQTRLSLVLAAQTSVPRPRTALARAPPVLLA